MIERFARFCDPKPQVSLCFVRFLSREKEKEELEASAAAAASALWVTDAKMCIGRPVNEDGSVVFLREYDKHPPTLGHALDHLNGIQSREPWCPPGGGDWARQLWVHSVKTVSNALTPQRLVTLRMPFPTYSGAQLVQHALPPFLEFAFYVFADA